MVENDGDFVEEVVEEEESLPETAEVETGAFGLGPDNSSEDAVARYALKSQEGNLLWVHDAGSRGELASWYGTRWGIGGTRALDAYVSGGKRAAHGTQQHRDLDLRRPQLESRLRDSEG